MKIEGDPGSSPPESGGGREMRLAEVIAECTDRINAGEPLDLSRVLAAHADLLPELEIHLETLQGMAGATRKERSRETLGDYVIRREVGRGGMGIVYEAWQNSMDRRVALKMLRANILADDRAVARFRREAKLAASLDHPGICTVYDAGVIDGIPYIAMRYIEGETLARRISRDRKPSRAEEEVSTGKFLEAVKEAENLPGPDQEHPSRGPDTREAVRSAVHLIEKAARFLHVAHEAGLVHRDIKPGNIMINREEEPVILDFGLARAERDESDRRTTQSAAILGTPAYMAPEQVAGLNRLIDRRTDVYSLGVTLYECLTHQLPFDAPTREGMFDKIRSTEPPDSRQINRLIPRDLKVILDTALEKDLTRRYQTALDFAEDLRRLRMYEPIRARPAPALLRLRRWIQRNPVASTATSAIVLFLTVGLVISLSLLHRVETAFERAEAMRLSVQAKDLLEDDPALGLLIALESARRLPGLITNGPLLDALQALREEKTLLGHSAAVTSARFDSGGTRVVTASYDGTAMVLDASGGEILAILRGHLREVVDARFNRDGSLVITASGDGTAGIWDSRSGVRFHVLRGHEREVVSAAFSPDGRVAVTASWDGTARIWDVLTGHRLHILRGHQGEIHGAEFSPDGEKVVTASNDSTARIWSARNGEQIGEPLTHARVVLSASFSPDGSRVVTASWDNAAAIWDAGPGRPAGAPLAGHAREVASAAFSPDGSQVVTASWDGTAGIWDASTGEPLHWLRGHSREVVTACFSPDGRRVVTASRDHTARVWDAASGKLLEELRGHGGEVRSARFSPAPENPRALTASSDHTARIWREGPLPELRVLRGHKRRVFLSAFGPDGRRVLTVSDDFTCRLWDLEGGGAVELEGRGDAIYAASFSPDGRRVLTVGNQTVWVWDAASGEPVSEISRDALFETASFSPDGEKILATFGNTTARIWEASSGKELATLLGHTAEVYHAAFSPDGNLVVTASDDGTARIWEASSGRCLSELSGHGGRVLWAAFSADGLQVITTSEDKTARIWDAATGAPLRKLEGHGDMVLHGFFSRDGRLAVTDSTDNTARIWEAATGMMLHALECQANLPIQAVFMSPDSRMVLALSGKTASLVNIPSGRVLLLQGHQERIVHAVFSPDGERVATASEDRTARIWDAGSGSELITLQGHEMEVISVNFSPDGGRLVTSSWDGTARIWPLDLRSVAERRKPRDLSPEERERFEIGTPRERRNHRQAWAERFLSKPGAQPPGLKNAAGKPNP